MTCYPKQRLHGLVAQGPAAFDRYKYALDPDCVIIDMHASHLWDASTIAALDAITEKYRRHGTDVKIIGLNGASTQMRERLGGKLSAGH